ncbi:hypothetical protein Tco_0630231 [Tanacetum coccineum]
MDVVTDDVVVSIPIVPLVVNVVTYLSDDGSPVHPPPLPDCSSVLPPPLLVCPPVLLPRGAAVDRPALHVVIPDGIIYVREDIGVLKTFRITAFSSIGCVMVGDLDSKKICQSFWRLNQGFRFASDVDKEAQMKAINARAKHTKK